MLVMPPKERARRECEDEEKRQNQIMQGLLNSCDTESVKGDNITLDDCIEAPINFKICGKEVQFKSDYVELEYIESTGSQYIDTGVKATGKTTVDIDFVYIPSGNNIAMYRMFLGLRESNFNFLFCINENSIFGGDYKIQSNLNIPNKTFDFTERNNLKTKINNNKYELYINDIKEKEVAIQDFSSTINMYMFAFNWDGEATTRAAKFKFYKCKIYDNDLLIRDFIPVKRKVDNVIGMYDLVEGKFYENNGTGNFVSGKELLLLNELKWVEGNQNVLHMNENIFDKNNILEIIRARVTKNSQISEADKRHFSVLVNCKPNTTYSYFTSKTSPTNSQNTLLSCFDEFPKLGDSPTNSSVPGSYDTITTTENSKYLLIYIGSTAFEESDVELYKILDTLTLVTGDEVPTSYIEHKSKTFELTNLPGLYSENDYIYYAEEEKKYFVHNEWNRIILKGTEGYGIDVLDSNDLYKFGIRNAMNDHEIKNTQSLKCNFAITSNNIANNNIRFGTVENANTLVLYLKKSIFSTANELKDFVKQKYESGNPLCVIYKTENLTDKEITDSLLIEQLDKIRKMFTYEGKNHFIVTSENGQACNLEVTAYKNTFKIMQSKIEELETKIDALIIDNA